MKTILFSLFLFGLIATGCSSGASGTKNSETSADPTVPNPAHTTQNSQDWIGIYKGTLPCADCQGIETTLELTKENTFILTSVYIGKADLGSSTAKGPFDWSDDYRAIRLQGFANKPDQYILGENTLTQLDMDGKVITGELADKYVLRKQTE